MRISSCIKQKNTKSFYLEDEDRMRTRRATSTIQINLPDHTSHPAAGASSTESSGTYAPYCGAWVPLSSLSLSPYDISSDS